MLRRQAMLARTLANILEKNTGAPKRTLHKGEPRRGLRSLTTLALPQRAPLLGVDFLFSKNRANERQQESNCSAVSILQFRVMCQL
jgi:hypothetical protein